MRKGVTLIELLLVVSIIALLGASTTPFLSRFVTQINFDMTRDKLVSSIKKSQSYAMDGKNNTTWGVCLNGNNIRLFSGSCASPLIFEDFKIPQSVQISGLSAFTFNKRGEPSAVINISINSAIKSATLNLNLAGGISIN